MTGDQVGSSFQVPFDAAFQASEPQAKFDYALPVAAPEHRGTIRANNYSPGSLHPAPDVHDFTIYLAADYGRAASPGNADQTKKQYPLLYLSHGA